MGLIIWYVYSRYKLQISLYDSYTWVIYYPLVFNIYTGAESELFRTEFSFPSAWSDQHNDSSYSFWFLYSSSRFFNRSRCLGKGEV